MGFRECIISARDQGVINSEEADDLIRRYEAHRRASAGAPDPDAAAKSALGAELEATAQRKQRLAALQADVQDEIVAHLHSYRGPDGKADVYEAAMRLLENFGFSGTSSVAGRAKAIVSLIHGELADMLRAFERNFYTGMRHNIPEARDVIREIHGEPTGRPEAKAFADAMSNVYERLRERFNAAGGDMELLDRYVPQFHDALAVKRMGFERWRDFVLPRLDLDRMKDPLTGGKLTPDRLGDALKASYDAIVTDGWSARTPSLQPVGQGAVANQRSFRRFLHFKTADDWLAYDRQFGKGDPIVALFQHVNGMARDIAAMELLGPNPAGTVQWLQQVVRSEHGKALLGDKDSLFNAGSVTTRRGMDAGTTAAQRIEDLWQWTRGRPVVNQGTSDFFSNLRNVLTSAQLGSAVVTAAVTDPAIERMARKAIGMADTGLLGSNSKVYFDTLRQLPVVRHFTGFIDHMTGMPRDQALRSGMIADDFLHILGEEARYAGTLGGSVWSRWMADRTVTLTGLTPLTEARRAVFQLELQGFIADRAGDAFADLPERLRMKLEGYGFDAKQWDTLRQVPQHRQSDGAAGLLRPIDVAQVDQALAERYVEAILGETERAVPTGTLRSKSYFLGTSPRGIVGQELVQSFLQYKSFGLSLMTLQWEAIAHETAGFGRAAGASYASQLFLLTTLGGAAALQLKQIATGKDPQNVKDVKFWMAAAASGGGFGIFGDFLFADVNRFGYSLAEQLAGPTLAAGGDLLKFTAGNMGELLQGKDTNAGKEAVDLVGKYTPLLGSAWPTRLAYRRELLDQLQYQLDPKAHRRWREEEKRALRERGQGFWWPHGERLPSRPPDLTRALP